VATLVAEFGEDHSRFPAASSVLAEAALASVTCQSGSSRRVGFRRAANRNLRAVGQQWILTAIRISPWTRTTYDAARARGQSHSRAVRSVGARWARILWRCWHDRCAFDLVLDRRVVLAARRAGLSEGVCLVHFTRNAQDLVPRSARSMLATAVRPILDQPAASPGPNSAESSTASVRASPAVADLLRNAEDELLTHLTVPESHRRQIPGPPGASARS
jgi:hypothetical protein